MKEKKAFYPDKIGSYFRMEWLSLTFVTLSGIFYNVGLLASPWFEGHLAQCLADILGGNEKAGTMAMLVLAYIMVTDKMSRSVHVCAVVRVHLKLADVA